MRPTPSWPPPCARPTRRCCTTAPAASTWPGPARSPGHDGVGDVLLGLLASVDEPIAGGRHKVFGHAALAIIPQTSTIASHLPRAMGVAFAIGRAARLGAADAVAGRRHRRGQLRRRLAQPLDGPGRPQRRRLHRPPGHADAAAARVRGQRLGDQRAEPGRLGRGVAGWPAGTALRAGRRHRSGRRARRRRGARRPRPRHRPAGRAAPADGALRRPRRHRRRVGVPQRRPASGPTSPATRCWPRPACSSTPASRRRRRSSPATSTAGGRCASGPPSCATGARLRTRRRGDRPAGAAPAGRRRRRAPRVAAPASGGRRSSVACPRTRAR